MKIYIIIIYVMISLVGNTIIGYGGDYDFLGWIINGGLLGNLLARIYNVEEKTEC